MKFIEVLKDLMIDKEMNLKVLAELTGMNKGSLYYYFKHESLPDLNCAIKISRFFDCSLNYLLGLDENKKTSDLSDKPFIENYQTLLKQANVANYKVCRDIGINRNLITYWRKGMLPKTCTLIELAKYFNVSVDYLVGNSMSGSDDEIS